jgi:hydroxypyruvate isomerase
VIRFSAHLSMLFTELPPLERPAAAREAGFELVESWWPPEGFVEEVQRCDLELACLNAYGGDIPAGERGFLNVPSRRDEAVAAFRAAVATEARTINVLVGRELPDLPRASQLDYVVDVLRELAALGGTIVIEPLNEHDVPGSLVPNAAEAALLLERVGADNVRLLYDAYHAARAGNDPLVEAPALVDLIGHVQYADCPGRGAPGTGQVDLDAFVAALEAAGYEGTVGLEFFADGPTRNSLGFLAA